ncbi:thioredoxin [Dokdonella sp.]|uniref:thioredoxin n=1 Tax=Dokdonella sp. TaxID=2291710 RepID=UPI001B1CE984|nr:thioredoxin [Dokdonella sp.]MBO9663604.1 thioredoxin [Dokdonella sp.]
MSAASPSPHVFDATEANFEAEVIQASFQQPVLVDLWATWCGPCKTLGPLLEKVVDEFNGAVRMAKVDCDKEQILAASFGVRSIPTVVLMRDGQLVDGFTGALPESAIREFLSRHVQPNAAAADGVDVDVAPLVQETPEQAIARLQQEIAAEPDKSELKLDLAVAQMQVGNAAAAEAELDALPANLAGDDRARRLRGQLEFAQSLKNAPAAAELRARIERDPDDHAARDLLGVRLLIDGDAAAGLDQFLHVLGSDRNWNEGQAKKRLIAAFNVLDDEDLVGAYRRKMASLLF